MAENNRKKKKRGRPKGPLNERERAQRKNAAVKHGAYRTGAARVASPCSKKHCPLKYPCDLKKHRDEQGVPTETCLASLPSPSQVEELVEVFQELQKGNMKPFDELAATVMGTVTAILVNEVGSLKDEGAAVEEVATDDNGDVVLDEDEKPVVLRRKTNPRLFAVVELTKIVGMTLDQLMLSPKAQKRKPPIDLDTILDIPLQGKKILEELGR